jgi:hypothetical protein
MRGIALARGKVRGNRLRAVVMLARLQPGFQRRVPRRMGCELRWVCARCTSLWRPLRRPNPNELDEQVESRECLTWLFAWMKNTMRQ